MATARQDASDAITGRDRGRELRRALVAGLRSGNTRRSKSSSPFIRRRSSIWPCASCSIGKTRATWRKRSSSRHTGSCLTSTATAAAAVGLSRYRQRLLRPHASCRRRPLPGDSDVELRESRRSGRASRAGAPVLTPCAPAAAPADRAAAQRRARPASLRDSRKPGHLSRVAKCCFSGPPLVPPHVHFADRRARAGRRLYLRGSDGAEAWRRLTEARRRRILQHAEHCPDCHSTVKGWSGAVVGLGIALPLVAVELFHTSSAAAAIAAWRAHRLL